MILPPLDKPSDHMGCRWGKSHTYYLLYLLFRDILGKDKCFQSCCSFSISFSNAFSACTPLGSPPYFWLPRLRSCCFLRPLPALPKGASCKLKPLVLAHPFPCFLSPPRVPFSLATSLHSHSLTLCLLDALLFPWRFVSPRTSAPLMAI